MHRRRQMLGTCPGAMWYPILEGECDMRVPQVSERIKEAPAQALRGVFAGIGQLLLITDKLRNKASHQDVPRARTPEASETVTDTAVTSPAAHGAGTAAAPAGRPAARLVRLWSMLAQRRRRPRLRLRRLRLRGSGGRCCGSGGRCCGSG